MASIKPRTNPASNADYFPPYGKIDVVFVAAQAENFIKWLWKDNKDSQKRKEIAYDFDCLLKIVDMIERRRLYYHIYHNGMKMSERKEIALYCYWTLKLQPFSYNGDKKGDSTQGNYINAIIAYRILLNATKAMNKQLPPDTLNPIMHSFRYHDISKEAFIALCEIWLK